MLALYHNPKQRLVCLGIAFVLLLCFYQDGDLTEEWCLPFASYPIWIYFRSLKGNHEIRPAEWLTIGLCFSYIAFIRINNASPFIGFIAFVWIQLLLKKEFKSFFKGLLLFVLGTLIVSGVCVLYFYHKAGWQGVDEMFYATFLSNFEYLGKRTVINLFLTILYFLFLSLCVLQQIINSSKEKTILIPTLLSYFAYLLSFGTRCFTHYLLSILPLVIVLMMTLQWSHKKKKPIMITIVCIATLFYLPIPVALTFNDLFLNDKYTTIYNDFHHCIENIPKEERDSIFNYNLHGNGAGMMQHEKLIQCNRVFFSSFAFTYKRLREQEAEKTFYPPKWIMVSWNRYFTKEDAYFIINNYDLYYEFNHDRMYFHKPKVGQTFRVSLYRRKE